MSVIEIGSQESCAWANPPFDHPCLPRSRQRQRDHLPYCSTLYRFAADLKAGSPAARMRAERQGRLIDRWSPLAPSSSLVRDRRTTASWRSPPKKNASSFSRRPSVEKPALPAVIAQRQPHLVDLGLQPRLAARK
jgi:uncharacterized Zn-finger protein